MVYVGAALYYSYSNRTHRQWAIGSKYDHLTALEVSMWRKQPEAKPSSPASPGVRDNGYAAQAPQRSAPQAGVGNSPASSPAPSATQAPRSDAAILTRGICIKGELTGKADLVIDGDVQGSIRLGESRLTVGQLGKIRANIEASEIVVRGQVQGNLRGRERVVLGSSCDVLGDLEAPRIAIEDGAKFKGRVEMGPAVDARERQNKRSEQPAPSRQSYASNSGAESPVVVEVERTPH